MKARFKGTVFEPLMKKAEFAERVKEEYKNLTMSEMILEAMEMARISKVDLARKMHTSPAAITRYTKPDYRKFRLDTLAAIAEAVGGTLTVSLKMAPGKGKGKKKVLSSELVASKG